jgi:hypothetical protein
MRDILQLPLLRGNPATIIRGFNRYSDMNIRNNLLSSYPVQTDIQAHNEGSKRAKAKHEAVNVVRLFRPSVSRMIFFFLV